jgi:hypothetical protein
MGAHASIWPARIIVLASGIVLGLCVWRASTGNVPRLYPVEFAHAQWLVAANEAPQGYFRQELFIPDSIEQAWITVAATDSFILYINGKAVDGKGYAALNVSGVYDVGHYLSPGKNVVGVGARRLSYPGPAMAVLEGVYQDRAGREHIVATDATWKFFPVDRTQGRGEIPWYDAAFDASAWTLARTAGRPLPTDIYPLGAHPVAFSMPPRGKWIAQADSVPGHGTFTRTLTLPATPEDAWVRIASGKPYALAINGITVEKGDTPQDDEIMQLLRFQDTAIWSSQEELSTDLYRIAPLLRAGLNKITISSRQPLLSLDSLFVDGFMVHGGEVWPFGSDATWTAVFPSSMAGALLPPQHATVLTLDPPQRDVLPVKHVVTAILPLNYALKQLATLPLILLLTAGPIYLLWIGTARILHGLQRGDLVEASRLDALAHLPTVLSLGGMYLLSFDVRFDPALPFRSEVIGLSVTALMICKILILLESWYYRGRHPRAPFPASTSRQAMARVAPTVLLICLVGIGAFLRLHKLDAQSLYHDEVHMVTYVQGLLEKGYPHKMIGPIVRPLATYELAPYPIALSVLLFGMTDYTLRLPAAVFGIMTIALIYIVGRQVFDRRVGLLAAAVYTFCPQAVIWAQYLWHPQQTQFFALLTSYLFYRAIRDTPLSPRYLYPATFAFIATYLSWEGSGFFLPALGLGAAVVKGNDLSWLRNKHLWIAVTIVTVAIGLQLTRRLLLQVQYLVIGQGLSDVSMPTLYFLDPMYDPFFYVKNFLWLENNVLLTLLVLGLLVLMWRQAGFAYYCMLLFSVILLMTNTLPNSAIRYVYYLQTFLILSASSSAFHLLDFILGLSRNEYFRLPKLLSRLILVVFIIQVTLMSSTFMKLFRLSNFSYPSGVHTRNGIYYIDYRTSAEYIKNFFKEGDVVFTIVADTFRYYSYLESEYYVQNYTMRQVLYDPSGLSHRYLERIVGNEVLRDINEVEEVLSKYRRVWVIAVPDSIFMRMSGPEIRKYIQSVGTISYESYNAKIYLIEK